MTSAMTDKAIVKRGDHDKHMIGILCMNAALKEVFFSSFLWTLQSVYNQEAQLKSALKKLFLEDWGIIA